ncbi:MAG: DNA mismatch repair endonuclease MutH [gamma proteobacterium symbiont of Taylorina sp.]|nr:DNA mismatch repair endonuclease MutH [gamma proteobacterium symbiont of Taylorina sp.]
MSLIPKPESENELITRALALSGKNLSQLATDIHWPIPENLNHNKGWIGQLIEVCLGATAGNLSEPDFQNLGIELKTIPLNSRHTPKETTYVCVVPLLNHTGLQWQDSCVYKKLKRVLWVPIEADPAVILSERKVGHAFLWSPTADDMEILQSDWEEFMELISLGQVESITAHQGEYLQIRPKAANASVITTGIGQDGLRKQTLPRGFYLRTLFTKQILQNIFS